MSGTGDVLGLALSPPISIGYRRLLISGRKSAMSVVLDKRNSPVPGIQADFGEDRWTVFRKSCACALKLRSHVECTSLG